LGTFAEDPRAQDAHWVAYEFKGKPTDLKRRPPMMSPYLWKLDWQMWFAAFGTYLSSRWVINFVNKLLRADPQTLSLLYHDPFDGARPRWIKIEYYRYQFVEADSSQRNHREGEVWQREYLGEWLHPMNLDDPLFLRMKQLHGWV
jgi:hypothetical protein